MEPLDNCWAWTTHITGLFLLCTYCNTSSSKVGSARTQRCWPPPVSIHIPHHHQPKLQRIRRALQDLAPTRPDPFAVPGARSRSDSPLVPGQVQSCALRCAALRCWPPSLARSAAAVLCWHLETLFALACRHRDPTPSVRRLTPSPCCGTRAHGTLCILGTPSRAPPCVPRSPVVTPLHRWTVNSKGTHHSAGA